MKVFPKFDDMRIELTELCNQDCVYCYNNFAENRKNNMSKSNFVKIIDNLEQVVNPNYFILYFTGGEPTLHPNFFEFLDIANRKKYISEILIITNGLFFSNINMVKKLKKYEKVRVQVSIQSILPKVHNKITKGNLDKSLKGAENLKKEGFDKGKANVEGSAKFAVECALIKIYGSEVLDYVADEAVQIFGGMGFSADMPVDRIYRDSRINRIFEGTNEINRMLLVGMILKKAMKGQLDIMTPAMKVASDLMSIPSFDKPDDSVLFAVEKEQVKKLKKAILMCAGKAAQDYAMTI